MSGKRESREEARRDRMIEKRIEMQCQTLLDLQDTLFKLYEGIYFG